MATYQNIFTRVQVRGPIHTMPLPRGSAPRVGGGGFSQLLGIIGEPQVGPLYLGPLGIASLIFGFTAFENHRPEHVRLGGLESHPVRPAIALAGTGAAGTKLRLAYPALGPGRMVDHGRFLPHDVNPALVDKDVSQGRRARPWHSHRMGIRLGDLALPCAWFYSPRIARPLVGSSAVWHIPSPGLDRRILDPIRQSFL